MKYGQSEFALTRATKELWDNKPASFTYQPRDLVEQPYVKHDNRPVKRYVKTGYGARKTKANAYFQKDRIEAVIGMNA